MALIIFKYCLPILLGYTFFVGLSGRYLPAPRPDSIEKRPMWFLALWTGICVAAITIFGLHLAYQMDLSQLSTLLIPGAWIFTAAMVPGIIGYLTYRSSVKRHVVAEMDSHRSNAIAQNESDEFDNTLALDDAMSLELDDTVPVDRADILDIDEQTTIWATEPYSTELTQTKMHDAPLFNIDAIETNEPVFVDDADADIALPAMQDQTDATQPANQTTNNSSGFYPAAQGFYPPAPKAPVEKVDIEQPELEASSELESETLVIEATAQNEENMAELNRLREELEAEKETRKELEKHLRATRTGLGALESESREFASKKAAALTQMEKELEEKIKRTSAAEARAEREAAKRVDLENNIVQLREDALKATTESRVSAEARAQALSTANKATTLARQAMQIRSRLETQLRDAQTEINSKQETISSLIKALEKAKARTQEDVASMAKQLVLHEKQMQARRTLEEVSRSVDKKLSTRLVKKVAKARG